MNGEAFGFEAIFEALVETIPEPVFFTDLEGSILSISQRAVDMLGYPSKEKLLGQPARTLMAPEEQERADSIPQYASEEKLQNGTIRSRWRSSLLGSLHKSWNSLGR